MDNRASVVTAMALLTLYICMDLFIPKRFQEAPPSSYYQTVKAIFGALTVLVLGNMLLNSKVNDQPY